MPTQETDGRELESAEERNRANPESFGIASLEERTSLKPGALVKLLFLFMNEESGQEIIGCERMWVRVSDVRDGRYIGHLEDSPATSDALCTDAIVEFLPEHVATVMIPRTDPRHPEYVAALPHEADTLPPKLSDSGTPVRPWCQFWR